MKKPNLEEQAKKILEEAEKKGITNNYFFSTTFERYQMQIKIMKDLAVQIEEMGPTVSKEYVKGRGNVYTNPAITEYNKTSSAANGTVVTLIKIMTALEEEKPESKLSALRNIDE